LAKRNIRISDKHALRFTNYSVMDAEERLNKNISDVFEEFQNKKLSIKNMVVLFRAAMLHQFEDEEEFTVRKASQVMDEFEVKFVIRKVFEALKEYMNPNAEKTSEDKSKNVLKAAPEKE
jgi:hypothetical protein